MQKVGIVSHDAGGAELLSHWLPTSKDYSFSYHLSGPAINIFKKNVGTVDILSLDKLVEKCSSLICGTSWQSQVELSAIEEFKKCGKHTIAFLDHWANYDQRFRMENKLVLPDEIWVVDEYAEKLAKTCFPGVIICRKNNWYFEKIKKSFLNISNKSVTEKSILYVCEPIREHAFINTGNERYWGYTEESALEYFLENITFFGKGIESIVVRPHPSENLDKYSWVLDKIPLPIALGSKDSLTNEINNSTVVVGCESMAMIAGLLADKLVVSSIPPGGRQCQLPHHDILHLSEIVKGGKPLEA